VAEGNELSELSEEIMNNKIINIDHVSHLDLKNIETLSIYTDIKKIIIENNINMLAINMHHSRTKDSIPLMYDLLLQNINILNFADLYEEIFERIPLDNIDAG
jgi:hypothetical protein